jgi:ABC-2 type transport system permease protein
MTARAIRALTRASWLTAKSYRVQLLLSLGSLILTVVPLYFVAKAVEPIARRSIADQGGDYFGFVLLGYVGMMLVGASVNALPSALSGGIGTGYFEALLATPARRASLLVGMSAYSLLFTAARGAMLLASGALLGVTIAWGQAPAALVILLLIVVAHWGIGLVGAALIVAFRTMGPLPQAVIVTSTLFGGVYYSTTVIPSWIQNISAVTPLAYGLRALRRLLLADASLGDTLGDVAVMGGWGVAFMLLGGLAFGVALRYARRAGSLNTY